MLTKGYLIDFSLHEHTVSRPPYGGRSGTTTTSPTTGVCGGHERGPRLAQVTSLSDWACSRPTTVSSPNAKSTRAPSCLTVRERVRWGVELGPPLCGAAPAMCGSCEGTPYDTKYSDGAVTPRGPPRSAPHVHAARGRRPAPKDELGGSPEAVATRAPTSCTWRRCRPAPHHRAPAPLPFTLPRARTTPTIGVERGAARRSASARGEAIPRGNISTGQSGASGVRRTEHV